MALLRAKAFLKPVTMMTTSLLSKTVATPTVKAILGTAEISLLKNRALARMVSYASVLIRVLEASEEPLRVYEHSFSQQFTAVGWTNQVPIYMNSGLKIAIR
jgi:hypothetical protein